jgi:hypothetical protein
MGANSVADVADVTNVTADPGPGMWALERLVLEVVGWRMELEWRLAGAILRYPDVGLLRADEAGVTADVFEREDVMLIYQAVRAAAGMDKVGVLAMAMHVLKRYGYWRPGALPAERGMNWSERNLVDLANGDDGPGDVAGYARQLRDLDRRLRTAGALWRRMYRVLDGAGRDGVPQPADLPPAPLPQSTVRPPPAPRPAPAPRPVVLGESQRPKDHGTANGHRGPEVLRRARDDAPGPSCRRDARRRILPRAPANGP